MEKTIGTSAKAQRAANAERRISLLQTSVCSVMLTISMSNIGKIFDDVAVPDLVARNTPLICAITSVIGIAAAFNSSRDAARKLEEEAVEEYKMAHPTPVRRSKKAAEPQTEEVTLG